MGDAPKAKVVKPLDPEGIDDALQKLTEGAEQMCAVLGLSSVQIVAVALTEDGYRSKIVAGTGSWYERYGAMRHTVQDWDAPDKLVPPENT